MNLKHFAIILLLALTQSFCLTGRVSEARSAQVVVSPEKHREAEALLNTAGKQFQDANYEASLATAIKAGEIERSFEALYLQGNSLTRLGKQDDALVPYLDAERIRPTDEQLELLLAVLYTSRGDLEQAQIRYARLMSAYPQEPLYALKAGTNFKIQKKYEDAYTTLKKADVPGFKQRDRVMLQLGDVCVERKSYDEANYYFKKAKELNPSLKDAEQGANAGKTGKLLEEGNRLFKEKRYADALTRFEAAQKESPLSTAPYYFMASSQYALTQYPAAEASLNKLLQINPEHTDGILLLSGVLQKQGRQIEAEKLIRTEIQKMPDNPELHNRLGVLQKDGGDTRQAIQSFHKATSLNPKYTPARLNLALAYLDDGRYSDADREYLNILISEPKNDEAAKGHQLVSVYTYLDAGDRNLTNRRFDSAIAEYFKALGLRSDLPVVHNAIGRAEFEKQNFPAAEGRYSKSLSLDDENATAMVGLVRTYRAWGRRTEAEKINTKLNNLAKKNPSKALELGRLKEDENPAEAEAFYKKILKDQPDNSIARRRLAGLYYKQGLEANKRENYDLARTDFERAKALTPDLQGLEEALAVVQDNIKHSYFLPTVRQAEAYYNRGHCDEALPLYEQVYAKWDRSLLLVKIAACKLDLGRKEEALRTLNNALEKKPEDIEISEALSTYYLGQGEVARAKEGFERIANKNENAYYSIYKLGIIELIGKKQQNALQLFTKSLIYKPDFAEAKIARGVARYELGDRTYAQKDFEDAMKSKAGEIAALNLGIMNLNDTLVADAQKIFEELARKYPDYADPHYQMSFIHYSRNELDEAEREIEISRKLREDPEDLAALARILEKKYQTNKSTALAARIKDVHNTILTKYPSSARAEESRKQLTKMKPGEPVLQAYPSGSKIRPALSQNLIYFVDNKMVQAFDNTTRRVVWRRFFDENVRSVTQGPALLALMGKKLAVLDPLDGAVLKTIPCTETSRVVADQDRFIVVEADGSASLHTLKDKIAVYAATPNVRYYLSNGNIYRATRSKGILIEQLNDQLTASAKLELDGNSLPEIENAGQTTFVLIPGQKLYLVGSSFKADRDMDAKGASNLVVNSTGVLAYSTARILWLTIDGQKVAEFAGNAITSARVLPDGRILVAEANGLKIMDRSGKVKWTTGLPGDQVQSLYF